MHGSPRVKFNTESVAECTKMSIAGTRSLYCGVDPPTKIAIHFFGWSHSFNRLNRSSTTIHLTLLPDTWIIHNEWQSEQLRPSGVSLSIYCFRKIIHYMSVDYWLGSSCCVWFYSMFWLATCFNAFLWTQTWSHSRTTSRVLAPSGGQSSLTFGLRPIPKAAPEVAAAVVAVAAAADETSVVNVNEPKTFVNPDVIPTVVSGKWTSGIYILSLRCWCPYTTIHFSIFVAYLRQKNQSTQKNRWLQIKMFRKLQQHQLLRQRHHPKRCLPRLCYRLSNKN